VGVFFAPAPQMTKSAFKRSRWRGEGCACDSPSIMGCHSVLNRFFALWAKSQASSKLPEGTRRRRAAIANRGPKQSQPRAGRVQLLMRIHGNRVSFAQGDKRAGIRRQPSIGALNFKSEVELAKKARPTLAMGLWRPYRRYPLFPSEASGDLRRQYLSRSGLATL
jgi:hypothetical protein